MLFPAGTGSGASVLDTARTGDDVTVVVIATPAVGAVSLLSMLNVALVITFLYAGGLARYPPSSPPPHAPALSAPMFQVTTPAASVPPPVADTKEVFPGTVSVMT